MFYTWYKKLLSFNSSIKKALTRKKKWRCASYWVDINDATVNIAPFTNFSQTSLKVIGYYLIYTFRCTLFKQVMKAWLCALCCVLWCLLTDGSSSHGLDGMLSYSSMPRQQLLSLDPNLYGGEQFRHGLTPPQLGPEQMHPYGKRQKSLFV